MTVLEKEVASKLGLLVTLRMGLKPATPAKHLLQEARKVYSCAASRLERWLLAMDGEYLIRIVVWRFSRSFDELKTSILNDLDTGFESLHFLMQVAPRFMSEMVNSALQQVSLSRTRNLHSFREAFITMVRYDPFRKLAHLDCHSVSKILSPQKEKQFLEKIPLYSRSRKLPVKRHTFRTSLNRLLCSLSARAK